MKLSGNTILITGATSGIGLAFAEKLQELGSSIIICGRREDRLQKIKQLHPAIITKRIDIEQAHQREELFRWTIQNHPQTNILINNAGIQLATDLTKEVNLERVRSELEINLIAPIHLSSLFASHLSGLQASAIINISSGLAFSPLAFMPIYCASKAAIHSFSLSLRYQLRDTSVKVFEIIPPSVDTELGHDRRTDKSLSHGGMPVAVFVKEALDAIEKDELESAVAFAKGLWLKREELFMEMNSRVSH